MSGLFHVLRSSVCRHFVFARKRSFDTDGIGLVNVELVLRRFHLRCFSSKRSSGVKLAKQKKKKEPMPVKQEDKDAFFVIRKGDVIGVYKSMSECQLQVGTSVCDPPVSVYKGYSMPKEAEGYLLSYGLKNPLYSIKAADITRDLFGPLMPCPFQLPTSLKGEPSGVHLPEKRSQEVARTECAKSCVLEFDGASKGNPGQAGAGAVLRRADDGSLICRLREGLGVATCNVAEYRGIILGLKYALEKGFTSIRVRGDSKLVCMQIQGQWKVKNKNISMLFEEASRLKERFLSFEISHILRNFNSEADAQANLGAALVDGQIQEEIDK